MSKKENEMPQNSVDSQEPRPDDPLGPLSQVTSHEIPPGVDRRTFLMRSAVVGATAVIVGRSVSAQERSQRATGTPVTLDPTLDVVKKAKGPVLTTLDEFYKVGPGPSSSHTILSLIHISEPTRLLSISYA